MTVRVKIKEYIQQVTEAEATKPPAERKPIPRQVDLANRAGVPRQTVYNFFARDETKLLNLDMLDAVIKTFRAFGHDTQLTDLLEFTED